MTKEVQFRRGSTEDHVAVGAGFTGAVAEVTVDTTNNTLRVHDGTTKGGHELVGVAVTQRISNKDVVAIGLTVSGISTFDGSVNANQGLSVSGGLDVTYGATSDRLNVTGISTFGLQVNLIEDQAVVWHDGNNNNAARIYATSNDEIRIDNTSSNTERLRITSGGNVGIGTTNPTSRLQVEDNVPSGTSNVYINNTGGDAVLYLLNNDQYSAGLGTLADNGSYIELSGKWNSTNTNANRTFGKIGAFKENNTSANGAGYLALYSRPDGSGLTERLRITSDGNVGIGSTNVTEKLHVLGNIKTSGNILNALGDRFLVGVSTVTVLTSGTTYTPPANLISALVIATGGGGGGGGADGADVTSGAGGGGGGSGATAIRCYTAFELGASATYSIGGAGANGSGNGTSGTAGGNTTFTPAGPGATLTANGGALGTGSGAQATGAAVRGGLGGSASGGQLNTGGGDGGDGGGTDTTEMGIGGVGGGSFWGGGGSCGMAANAGATAGTTASTYGSGGGGAGAIDTTTGAAGGAGFQGVIFVLEFTG